MRSHILSGAFFFAVTALGYGIDAYAQKIDIPSPPVVSPAERRVIDAGISKLRLAGERKIARGWSPAKQVAEFICHPAALRALKTKLNGVDRVFLGTDDQHGLDLQNDSKLLGQGQVRYEQGWRSFSFECLIDPGTAKVTDFQASWQDR
ncbi:hypothetical protein [Pandoraea sputorum]|uniref:DUF930 domain-containing protein n=1 Tax=Pandoraea sputorum TaxID=93222 RepID=A0A5E5ASL5_9BURK|nr:hypothetical protein [Pandoraea sputorum]VVE75782.1 hypothetical protein PSP31121_00598 [Pandoraea sputorum]